MLATVSACCINAGFAGQTSASTKEQPTTDARIIALGLPLGTTEELEACMRARDYRNAERLLLHAVNTGDHSPQAARLLTFLGGVYFSAGDMLQAAVAWKKSDAIRSLDDPVRFSLAMAYVRLGHGDWAKVELTKLAGLQPGIALYPYWLGRIEYDAQNYQKAIVDFQRAIALDGHMARAHDSLGLCYFYLNQNALAEKEFRQAIALESSEDAFRPWPHLNLAIELEFTGHLDAAAAELERALALDPAFPQAQFELGNVLEHMEQPAEAKAAFAEAARLDPTYPEPHVALARLLRREGDRAGSEREVEIYKRLHAARNQGAPGQHDAP